MLGQLDDADADWLASAGERRAIPVGSLLIEQGRPLDAVFIVLEGRFDIYGAASTIGIGPGEMLGEVSFVDQSPPTADLVASEDSLVLAVPRAELQARLTADMAFASRFYRAVALLLSHRLRRTAAEASGDPRLMPAQTDEDVRARARRLMERLRT
jgi:CRP/FNR family cyclic AMP-dependent transcriptional regulator